MNCVQEVECRGVGLRGFVVMQRDLRAHRSLFQGTALGGSNAAGDTLPGSRLMGPVLAASSKGISHGLCLSLVRSTFAKWLPADRWTIACSVRTFLGSNRESNPEEEIARSRRLTRRDSGPCGRNRPRALHPRRNETRYRRSVRFGDSCCGSKRGDSWDCCSSRPRAVLVTHPFAGRTPQISALEDATCPRSSHALARTGSALGPPRNQPHRAGIPVASHAAFGGRPSRCGGQAVFGPAINATLALPSRS